MFHNFPYTNFHEINLDWIINKMKEKYGPDNPPTNMVLSVNGMTGDVILYEGAIIRFPDTDDSSWNLHRLANGVSSGIEFNPNGATRISGTDRFQIYDEDNPPEYPVLSVNGQTGTVVLYQSNIVRLPDTTETTWNFYRLVDETQAGIQFSKTGPAQRIAGTDRFNIYDAGNPPPYPVTSVNNMTGAVTIDVPVTSVNGQTGNVVIQIPVTSVNGHTGIVNTPFNNINADVLTLESEASGESWGMERPTPDGSLGFTVEYNNGHTEAYIYYDGPGSTTETLKLLTQADIPSSAGVVSINGQTGAVTLYGNDIYTASGSSQTVTGAIQAEASRASTAEGNLQTAINTAVGNLQTAIADRIIIPDIAIPIPAVADGAIRYNMTGITADHVVIDWRFTTAPDNEPQADITIETFEGYFTIQNTEGITTDSVKPVFAVPTAKTTVLNT